jgi:hypothetical protein
MNNFFAKTLSSLNDSRPEAEKAHNQKMHKQLEEKGVEREKERERERERDKEKREKERDKDRKIDRIKISRS